MRPRPERDDKILTACNALAVRGLAIAGRLLDDPLMVSSALRCIDFLSHNLWQDSRLYATWRQGETKYLGYLDDYAFMMEALLECLETQWRDQDYRLLVELAERTISLFGADEGGALYFSSTEHDPLIFRTRPIYDRVTPSGNGIAAKAFARLGHLTSEERYIEVAQNIVDSLYSSVELQPELHDSVLQAIAELDHPIQVMLTGSDAGVWRGQVVNRFINRVHCYAVLDELDVDDDDNYTRALLCVGDEQAEYESLDSLLAAIDLAMERQPETTLDTA
jgi:uncharacterized protein YyaL (SSP411 family)